MASFNASISDVSQPKVALEDAGNQTGQCTPLRPPTSGTLRLVSGNGTSVGTVMTLLCPIKHEVTSGSTFSCVQDNSIPQWSGGVPECKPLPGWRLAVLMSIVSVGIIIFMTVIFMTSCLLKRVKKEEKEQAERRRNREEAEFWSHMDTEEQRNRGSLHNHNSRNSNNNNNNRSILEDKWHSLSDTKHLTFIDHHTTFRCNQQDHPDLQSSRHSQPAATPYINTQATFYFPQIHCSGYDHTLTPQSSWVQNIQTGGTQDGRVLAVSGDTL